MGRGPWVIAGGIVVAGLIVASTLWVLDLRGEPVSVVSPGASPSRSPRGSPSPTPSESPPPSPTTSPTGPQHPLREARQISATFFGAWVSNNRQLAARVATPEAVRMAFLVPVRSRDSTILQGCVDNDDLGADAYQCTVADRESDIVVMSLIARPHGDEMVIDEVIFHAD